MKELCVVHLVRAHNGIEPFRRFLKSYLANQGGIEHDFLVVFKGFDQSQGTAEYRKLLSPFEHTTFDVSDEGFDITAYYAAFNSYSEQYRYFCFLNSYCEILDCDWLRKLHEGISRPGVGLVGATGSWESQGGRTSRWQFPIAAALANFRLNHNKKDFKGVISEILAAWQQEYILKSFDLFPNFHVRTNAFMISSELMKKINCSIIRTKKDSHLFESGKKGLSKQILEMGKRLAVVGKDGKSYEKEHWPESNTFRQSDQENLLVADNQTRDYQLGSPEKRKSLSAIAWGATNRGKGHG